MRQLEDAKGIVAGVMAEIDRMALTTHDITLAVDLEDLSEKLEEALGAVCAADVEVDADALMERAKDLRPAESEAK